MTRDLVERAMHGDRDAFGVLVERSLDRLVGTAGLILHDADAADDATQEALIRAWRDVPTLRNPDHFGSWLYRILLNRCADHIRRRPSNAHSALALDHPTNATDSIAGLGDRDELATAVAKLKHEHRVVIVLRFYLQLSVPEIAAVIGQPLGTVKSRLSRAMEYLRAELDADARSPRTGEEPA